MFLSDCINLLEYSHLLGGKLDTGGNLNVHFDRPTDPSAAKMLDVIQLFGLSRAVEATRLTHLSTGRMTGFFDLSLRATPCPQITCQGCYPDIAKPQCCPLLQTTRNLRCSDKSQFRTDVSSSTSSQHPSAVDDFNSQLRSVPT